MTQKTLISKRISIGYQRNKSTIITQSLCEPNLVKNKYLREIRENSQKIKKNTAKFIKDNYLLRKKEVEINKLTREHLMLNNPSKYNN